MIPRKKKEIKMYNVIIRTSTNTNTYVLSLNK